MTVEEMKARKIELGLTNEMIAEESGVPLSTVQKIFSGVTKAPRKLTIMAMEKVLKKESLKEEADSGVKTKTQIQTETNNGGYRYLDEGSVQAGKVCDPGAAGQFYGRGEKEAAGWQDSREEKHYTIDDYYSLPEDQRVELIDGSFYDMGAPALIHQKILGDLYLLFRECTDGHEGPCEVFLSPCDVRLDRDNYTMLQPDLLVTCQEYDIQASYYEGAPDLVVEILSPSTRSKDLLLKLYKYHQAGVREYWIIDPRFRTVTVHYFAEEDYHPVQYDFDSRIPVAISKGECEIDFSKISENLQRYYDK